MLNLLLFPGPLHNILERFLLSFLNINRLSKSLDDSLGYFISSLLFQPLLEQFDSLFSDDNHDCLLVDLGINGWC
jgi:hypothetical protein